MPLEISKYLTMFGDLSWFVIFKKTYVSGILKNMLLKWLDMLNMLLKSHCYYKASSIRRQVNQILRCDWLP